MKDSLPSTETFSRQLRIWETLGKEDPLWAVLSVDEKRGNRWNLEEFLETGRREIAQYVEIIKEAGWRETSLNSVLDFGCGVGRLSAAWTFHAKHVTGVDISSSMLRAAEEIHKNSNLRFVHNPHSNLDVFSDSTFDLVFSHICLQHIPVPIMTDYLREFCRVCSPGGWIVFQLPSRPVKGMGFSRLKKWFVEHLPFGLDAQYRKWRHGSSVAFDVFSLPSEEVEKLFSENGCRLALKKKDFSAGANFEGYIYVFRKSSSVSL